MKNIVKKIVVEDIIPEDVCVTDTIACRFRYETIADDVMLLCRLGVGSWQWMSTDGGMNRWNNDSYTSQENAIEDLLNEGWEVYQFANFDEFVGWYLTI